jgi:oxygen-independent coproporphyrinogen-3 oxidase
VAGNDVIVAPLPSAAAPGIYIHIPFCAHICPYCDFTTYAGKDSLIPRYVDCLVQDIRGQQDAVDGRPVATIFIGGGTPSLLDGGQVDRFVSACRAAFTLLPDAEVTMECNPNGLDEERLRGYREAGVNRLSIGAQTFDRRGVRTLGRQHEAPDVLAALEASRRAGFDNVSLDFIFGWPGQSLAQWRSDLEAVLALPQPPEHLSLYSLIVEPGTPFADAAARGILRMPDDDATADMYEAAMEILGAAGWSHYEVANWSRHPGGYSRHNAIYWQHGDFLGIGAGAHGTVGNRRTMQHLLPERWCAAVEAGEPTASNTETIDHATSMAETMLLGLRLLERGVQAGAFEARHGVALEEVYGSVIDDLAGMGLLERTGTAVRLTPRGLLLANDVIARFL